MTIGRQQGKSWTQLLREHLEDHHAKTIHQMLWDKGGIAEQTGTIVYGDKALAGYTPKFVIIDEIRPLVDEEIRLLLKEFGAKQPKPRRNPKQPEWARHNQAPRSARRKR